ncbi:MAG TPA: hypothetical protein VHN99_01025, partial [Deinococcales bacterium]|nr:hypothetical protein [Deinococcales bacterium]
MIRATRFGLLALAALLGACPAPAGGGGSPHPSLSGPGGPVWIVQGQSASVDLTVNRDGATGPLTVTASGLPAGVSAAPVAVPDGAATATLTLSATVSAAQGPAGATLALSGASQASAALNLFVRGPAGSLDTTFATGGVFDRQLGATYSDLTAAAALPDGSLLAAGTADSTGSTVLDALIVKFRPDGSLDPAFGAGGQRRFAAPGGLDTTILALAVEGDGKILFLRQVNAVPTAYDLTRLNPDGSVDTSYAAGGQTPGRAEVGTAAAHPAALAVAPDGWAALAGRYDQSPDFVLRGNAKADGTGSSFLAQRVFDGNAAFTAVAYDPVHGDFVVAGRSLDAPTSPAPRYLISRAGADPAHPVPDPWTQPWFALGRGSATDAAYAVTVDAQGGVIAAGISGTDAGRHPFGVARVLPTGGPDLNFGPDGTGFEQVGVDGLGARGVAVVNG